MSDVSPLLGIAHGLHRLDIDHGYDGTHSFFLTIA